MPWQITHEIFELIREQQAQLGLQYEWRDQTLIHHSARLETGVIIHGPCIIGPHAFIAAHAYLRDGVFIGEGAYVGPSSKVKASLIFANSKLAHLNYIGNSIIGRDVNLEAGAVIANHFNERQDKRIHVLLDGQIISTRLEKFGAIIGDHSRLGANAVTSPGTILEPGSVVARLALVEQLRAPL